MDQKARTTRSATGKFGKTCAAMLAAIVLMAASPAAASYDQTRTGHPLRVIAYIVHPIGVFLDRVIFRPFYWLGSQKGVKTVVGHTGED